MKIHLSGVVMPVNRTTLAEAVQTYLRMRQRGASSTYEQDRSILARFLRSVGDKQLRHLTPEHVEMYFFGYDDRRTGKHVRGVAVDISDVTFNGYRSRLAAFFSYCRALGWLRMDPMIAIRRRAAIPSVKTWLTATQLLALVQSASDERDRAFVSAAANMGLRSSELTRLRLNDLDLGRGWISVLITKTSERDQMPVPAGLDAALRRWLRCYADEVGPLDPEYYLFPRRSGARFGWHTGPDGQRNRTLMPGVLLPRMRWAHPEKAVQRLARSVGVTLHQEGVHVLRRSAGRVYYDLAREQGHDAALRETSAFLHHSRSSTTELYLGLQPERESRDTRLRGQPFLEVMATHENVLPLRRDESF